MRFNRFIASLAFALAVSNAFAQTVGTERAIPVKGKFRHASGMMFPETIAGYARTEIKAFGSGLEHVSVGYDGDSLKSTFFVYPGLESDLHSLRLEFLDAAELMTRNQGIDSATTYEPFTFRKDGYIVNGLVAVTEKKSDLLALFQCGKWMFKVRVTANLKEKGRRNELVLSFLKELDLTLLVKDKPWNPKFMTIVLYKQIVTDDTLAMCTMMAAAVHKGNVEKLSTVRERQAGFPGLDFAGILAGLEMLVGSWESTGKHTDPKFSAVLAELLLIYNAGFLPEFVYHGLEGTVIGEVPSKERLEEYRKWSREHGLVVSVYYPFYNVSMKK